MNSYQRRIRKRAYKRLGLLPTHNIVMRIKKPRGPVMITSELHKWFWEILKKNGNKERERAYALYRSGYIR